MTLFSSFLTVHITTGLCAVLVGILPIVTRKGGRALPHRRGDRAADCLQAAAHIMRWLRCPPVQIVIGLFTTYSYSATVLSVMVDDPQIWRGLARHGCADSRHAGWGSLDRRAERPHRHPFPEPDCHGGRMGGASSPAVSSLSNLARVSHVQPLSDGSWRLTMNSNAELVISRTYRDEVLKKLGRTAP